MDISVVIVNYNVKYFLVETLYSVKKSIGCSGLDVEIIVVDNLSTDGSIDFARTKFPDVIYIENKDNVGFSKANNQGVKIAKGKYVVILNPDTIVEEDTFSKCFNYFEKDMNIGALGVKMIDGAGIFLQESKRGFPTPMVAFAHMFGLSKFFPKSKILGKYHLGYLDKDINHEIDVLAGAFMMIPRSVYLEVGGFDESFFMYGEDIDLSFRIQQTGKKIIYFSEVDIIHFKGESTKRGSLNYVKTFYEAMQIFAKKHFKGSLAKVYILVINLAIYFQAFLSLTKGFLTSNFYIISDIVLFYVSFVSVSKLWAQYYFDNINYYDTSLYYYNFPIYIFLLILSQYINGLFYKPFNFTKIWWSSIFGLIIVAAVYGFFEEAYRSSRMIILIGISLGTLAIIVSRYIYYFFKNGDFDLSNQFSQNSVVVGNEQSLIKVNEIYSSASKKGSLLGIINIASENNINNIELGSIEYFEETLDLYNVDEIIFDRSVVKSSFIINKMKLLSKRYNFMLLSLGGDIIIGSKSSKNSGEWVTYGSHYELIEPENLRQKRMFDIIGSLVLIFTFFPLVFFQQNKSSYLVNIMKVLFGKMTLVGYVDPKSYALELPKIKPSLLPLSKANSIQWVTYNDKVKLNTIYAKSYKVQKDIRIFKSAFPYLQ